MNYIKTVKPTNFKIDDDSSIIKFVETIRFFYTNYESNLKGLVFIWGDDYCETFSTKNLSLECRCEIESLFNHCKKLDRRIKVFPNMNNELVLELREESDLIWETLTAH